MTKNKDDRPREHFSPLEAHYRHGKTLTPPLMRVPGTELLAWHSERLPEVLWAALLTQALPREDYMRHLSLIAMAAMRFREHHNVYLEHTAACRLSGGDFRVLFGMLLTDEGACAALSPLLLFDGLPDRSHWQAYLPIPDKEAGWSTLAAAISACIDRRARPAIDIRWLRVMFLTLQHRLIFREHADNELVAMLCEYPQHEAGDGAAEAMIASMEMMTTYTAGGKTISVWSEAFWRECLDKTGCVMPRVEKPQSGFEYEPAKRRWGEIYAGLVKHFLQTMQTTAVDPRHDAVFGLALYAMSLVTGMMRPFSTRPSGRHL